MAGRVMAGRVMAGRVMAGRVTAGRVTADGTGDGAGPGRWTAFARRHSPDGIRPTASPAG
jgi:hypothetical protein